MSVASRLPAGRSQWPLRLLLVLVLVVTALAPLTTTEVARGLDLGVLDHLVVSEVVTGGASASDELIELYNPTAAALPLEGLEVIYVTATGATISRRAAWALGAPSVPAGGHVLVANASGMYAPIADATFATGMAATGGSVAIRILGASSAIDAVGWGTAASSWLEGTPAAAPAAGSSIERQPGGALGSGQDTHDNIVDFAERLVPEPQNLGSPPTPDPAATPSPTPVVTPAPSLTPAPTPTPAPTTSPTPSNTPQPSPIPTPSAPATTAIADARSAADGTHVMVEGLALTGFDFHDGGGFVADATAGIAVLLTEGTFAAGDLVRVAGEIDDRFSQRTLRADAGGLVILGTGSDPVPLAAATGAISEALEGRLVRIGGAIMGDPTVLTSGLAFDVDDGSGSARVIVGTITAIDLSDWVPGAIVDLVGVAGQRDSSGSGTDGYRVLPRSPGDVIAVTPPTPSPTPSPTSGEPTPSPSPGAEGVTAIAEAREAAKDTRLRIRGVVTLPSGLLDDHTAVLQDATGAILVRLGGDAGELQQGTRVEVEGKRATLSGMESLRVATPATSLGPSAEPAAREIRTGDAGEAYEALLVVARGAVVASARRSASGTVSFEIDDGSGPLRVTLTARLRADRGPFTAGTWIEARGILGQVTSRAKPDEGYRIWPRSAAEVRVVAATGGGGGPGSPQGGPAVEGGAGGGPAASLGDVGAADLSQLRIGATLVIGPWKELGVGGLLWDGTSLVAVHASSAGQAERLLRGGRQPVALELAGLSAAGTEPITGAAVVAFGALPGQTTILDDPPVPPRASVDGELPAWASLIGQLSGTGSHPTLLTEDGPIALQPRCADDLAGPTRGTVAVTGVAVGAPVRLIVPCGGMRPAPTLAMERVPEKLAGSPRASVRMASDTAAEAAFDLRRPIVAALLLAAAALLAACAVVARRRQSAADSSPAPDDSGAQTEAGARLTLVSVPRESGS